MRLIIGLLAVLPIFIVACGTGKGTEDSLTNGGEAPSDPVSVARIRMGEKINGECIFDDAITKYPVTFSGVAENCLQAVSIGPLSLAELEQMKRDEPSFWGKSSPYQQSLVGEWIDGKCDFSNPAVQAFLEFSENPSTDWTNCIMIVDVGPATVKQIEEVQRFGRSRSETAVPAPPEPALSQ